jgi:hypothetical protein
VCLLHSAIDFAVLVPLSAGHWAAESAFASLATLSGGLHHDVRATTLASWHFKFLGLAI